VPDCPDAPLADIQRHRSKGLESGIADLLNDLMRHPELIPYKGTLGGTKSRRGAWRMPAALRDPNYASFPLAMPACTARTVFSSRARRLSS
jgi:hypothetical protein